MSWPNWTELIQLIAAISSLLWPVAIIVLIVVFRNNVRALISGRKLKRGKFFGQEFELEEELDRLEQETEGLAEATVVIPPPAAPQEPAQGAPSREEQARQAFEAMRQILIDARLFPKATLMSLAAQTEAELRSLLEEAGAPVGPRTTFRDSVNFLRQSRVPDDLLDSLIRFRNIRNRIVHGHEADPDDILRAIDLGLRILNAIRSLPRPQKN